MARLTERQRAFVLAYHECGRSGRAAGSAGYTWPDRQGSRLCSRANVAAVLDLMHDLDRARRAAVLRRSFGRDLAAALAGEEARRHPRRRGASTEGRR